MPPYILLALLLGIIYGLLFYLWQGRTWLDLPIYLMVSFSGFLAGQLLARLLGSNLFPIGLLHIAEASVMSGLWLIIARWLRVKYPLT